MCSDIAFDAEKQLQNSVLWFAMAQHGRPCH
jgi:hypothetical protein